MTASPGAPGDFAAQGRRVWGVDWVPDAADYFEVSGRTARRWKSGAMEPPPGVLQGMAALDGLMLAPGLELHRLRPGEFLHRDSGVVFSVRPVEQGRPLLEGEPRPEGWVRPPRVPA